METGSFPAGLTVAVLHAGTPQEDLSGLLGGSGEGVVARVVDPGGLAVPEGGFGIGVDAVVLAPGAGREGDARTRQLVEQIAEKWAVVVVFSRDDRAAELEMLGAGAEACVVRGTTTADSLARTVLCSTVRWRRHSRRESEKVRRTLRDSEALYHSLVETLTQNILRKDLEGRFTFASSSFCRTIGKPLEEILGKTDHDLFPAELARKYRADDLSVIGSGKAFETEEEHTTPDGKHLVVKVVKTPVVDSTGKIIGTQGIFWDITEQKRAEAELASSRERFELAVRGSTDGIWDWNVLTDEVYYSDRCKELLGYAASASGELPRAFRSFKAFDSLLHPDDRASRARALDAHLNFREPYDVEFRLRCADGQYRWFHARAEAVRNHDGRATRMAGSISDIHARKVTEEALRVRTAELEKSNHDLEQFAYIASHDLKEPLRMVSSYVQLLERRYADKLDDDAREFIGFAVSGARRMKVLIEDLLVYSRVGTKGKELARTNLRDAFDAAVENLKVAIAESRAAIDCAELPAVVGDPVQLTQLFQNLIGNAIKFHGDAPPVVTVSARRNGNFWVISVTDNGIGMDPAHRERIFEIFQRLHDRSHYEGTGIGLAVARKIVERHGGEISVATAPGEGATFAFSLVAAEDPEAVPA